jgi:hypothetical protein
MVSASEELALRPLFRKNAFHCVCLLGDCQKSALNANGNELGNDVRRVSNVA